MFHSHVAFTYELVYYAGTFNVLLSGHTCWCPIVTNKNLQPTLDNRWGMEIALSMPERNNDV